MPAAWYANFLPGCYGADKANSLGAGVCGDLISYGGAFSGHHVEDAGREVCLDDALGELDGADSGARGGGPHYGVAGGERGSQ